MGTESHLSELNAVLNHRPDPTIYLFSHDTVNFAKRRRQKSTCRVKTREPSILSKWSQTHAMNVHYVSIESIVARSKLRPRSTWLLSLTLHQRPSKSLPQHHESSNLEIERPPKAEVQPRRSTRSLSSSRPSFITSPAFLTKSIRGCGSISELHDLLIPNLAQQTIKSSRPVLDCIATSAAISRLTVCLQVGQLGFTRTLNFMMLCLSTSSCPLRS
jgi:hypothetical protein